MPSGDTNYIHEEAIWRQRLKTETEGAAEWHKNWGFLAGKPQPEPRGFSTNVAKYAYGGGQWSVKTVRVPDNSDEGVAAAESEQRARSLMSTLTWQTQPANPTKPCSSKVRAARSAAHSSPRTTHSPLLVVRTAGRDSGRVGNIRRGLARERPHDAIAQIPIARRCLPHRGCRSGRQVPHATRQLA